SRDQLRQSRFDEMHGENFFLEGIEGVSTFRQYDFRRTRRLPSIVPHHGNDMQPARAAVIMSEDSPGRFISPTIKAPRRMTKSDDAPRHRTDAKPTTSWPEILEE